MAGMVAKVLTQVVMVEAGGSGKYPGTPGQMGGSGGPGGNGGNGGTGAGAMYLRAYNVEAKTKASFVTGGFTARIYGQGMIGTDGGGGGTGGYGGNGGEGGAGGCENLGSMQRMVRGGGCPW